MRYANDETPQPGDRIRNSTGGLGTVRAVLAVPAGRSGAVQIRVKWDEGIFDIDYDLASRFTLVSRRSTSN